MSPPDSHTLNVLLKKKMFFNQPSHLQYTCSIVPPESRERGPKMWLQTPDPYMEGVAHHTRVDRWLCITGTIKIVILQDKLGGGGYN